MILDLSRPTVMGILNVTPDSFSDGGRFFFRDAALKQAETMVAEGASIIDVGGESTRPRAPTVSEQEELDRIMPVLEGILAHLPVAVSVDTSKPGVIREALRLGVSMINDVRALREPGALDAVAGSDAWICLMHMQGNPATMQNAPVYDDMVADIKGFLRQRMDACLQAGISRERLMVDPGFGFGKTQAHNLTLLRRLGEFHDLDLPLMVGLSRKSTIGNLLNAPPEERLHGSVAAAVIAAWQGAWILRVHDVRPTAEALTICTAVQNAD